MGHVCRGDFAGAGRGKPEEGGPGTFRRRVRYRCTERVGFAGQRSYFLTNFRNVHAYGYTYNSNFQVESFEAPLTADGLRDPSTPFTGVFIRAPVCFLTYMLFLDRACYLGLSRLFYHSQQPSPTPPSKSSPAYLLTSCRTRSKTLPINPSSRSGRADTFLPRSILNLRPTIDSTSTS